MINIRFIHSRRGRISQGMMNALKVQHGDYIRLDWDLKREVLTAYPTSPTDPLGIEIVHGAGPNWIPSSVFYRVFPGTKGSKEPLLIEFEFDEDENLVHYANQEG